MKIVVVGAGIIGVTSAYELAARGHEVTLLDKREGAGLETSYANGGQIGACEVAPWAGPEVPGLVLRWLGRADAPFRLKLKADPEQWIWLLRFLMRCRASARAQRVLPNLALALLTQARMDAIAAHAQSEGAPITFNENRNGILQIFRHASDLKAAAADIETMRSAGLEQNICSARECVDLEPALVSAIQKGEIAGGIYCASDRSGDAHLFTARLAEKAQRMGVAFVTGAEVTGFETLGDRISGVRTKAWLFGADAVVLAAGVATTGLARLAGLRLPVYPLKGYSVTLPVKSDVVPSISITDEARKIVVSRLGDKLRTAGTAEVCGYDTNIEMLRARSVLAATLDIFPQMNEVAEEAVFWTGLRPMSSDGSPIIGQAGRFTNLYLNTGHGSLGWTLGAGSAAALGDLICGTAPQLDLTPFNLKRFYWT
ncbi:MAG: D-amino acid dehydrogenase [Parvibaculum sp.]|uniref:D-amino acid dehydrogenase n=1 Tax=Parvibaculum sp. TaxID=2024848 RepID=UPI003C77C443